MSNRIRHIAAALIALAVQTACASSGDPTGTPTPPPETPTPVATISLNQTTAALAIGQTAQLSATTRSAAGTTLTGRSISWSSNASSVASVSSTGLVTANAPGTARITATSEGRSAEATITVAQIPVHAVEITIPAATLQVGQTTTIAAVAKSAEGSTLTGRTFTWSSSNTAVATVSPSGVVTAVSPGETSITATSEGKSADGAITVVPVPVTSVQLSATTASIVVGTTTTLTATPRAADNTALTGRTVTWTTANATIVTVANGVVTGVSPGVTTVTATSEGKSADATITVTPVPVANVDVTPVNTSLLVGGSRTLTATARDASGVALTGRAITWSSSAPAVATVANGVVTAIASGNTTITATSEGKSGAAQILVVQPPNSENGRRVIAAGFEQTCALDAARKAWCWGRGWKATSATAQRSTTR